jgi:2-polyprenyl-3-methyl-5-hydroxy-6-metoxy-1,4-benzoquinol methylase
MALHHVPDPPAVIRMLTDHLRPGGWIALCDLDAEDGTFHDDPHAEVHHGFDRPALVSLVEGLGLQRIRTSTAWLMRLERPEGEREYPLFLLTAQRST